LENNLVLLLENSPSYSQLISDIKRYFPNKYRRHYKEHMEQGPFWLRMNLAEGLAHEINEHFVDMQHDGYKASEQPRPVQLPPTKNSQAIDKLIDYTFANYHFQGLTLRREANGQIKDDEEFPPLGEGAREYHNREWVAGVPISIGERRRIKICEICHAPFIDNSRAKNAKVCGDTCRKRKDVLRKRTEYNESELGLQAENRLKRYRERQQSDYPFYSPLEMYELAHRSERHAEDKRIDVISYKQDEEFDGIRFDGRRKPKYVGRDEFSSKPFNYRPKGRNPKQEEREPSPVLVRNLSEISKEELDAEKFIEADKMRGVWRLKAMSAKGSANNTSEKYAI